MNENTQNKAGNEGGSVTVGLPETRAPLAVIVSSSMARQAGHSPHLTQHHLPDTNAFARSAAARSRMSNSHHQRRPEHDDHYPDRPRI
jgi:hypothetical protein